MLASEYLVLHFQREDQLSIRVHRPRFGFLEVLGAADAPDARRIGLTARTAQPFGNAFVGTFQLRALELVPRGRDERANGVGVARMAQHEAVNTGAQNLFYHPVIVLHRDAVEAEHRQGDDDRRRAMAALGRTAVDETLHELAQADRIERAVLHLVLDQIDVRLGELLPFLVAGALDADVVNGLPGLEQLNHLVDAFGFVTGVSALGGDERREAYPDSKRAIAILFTATSLSAHVYLGPVWCKDTPFPGGFYAVVSDGWSARLPRCPRAPRRKVWSRRRRCRWRWRS